MTDTNDRNKAEAGRLFYDGSCRFCCRALDQVRSLLLRRGITPVPFENGAAKPEMRLRWHDGREFGGADAAIFLCGRVWWAWPLRVIAALPGIRRLARALYQYTADRRHCRDGACELPGQQSPTTKRPLPLVFGWALTTLLFIAAFAAGHFLNANPWQTMWLLSGALWAGFKIIAWSRATTPPSPAFFLWVGMDAAAFTDERQNDPLRPELSRVAEATLFLLAGLALLVGAFPRLAVGHPVFAGWCGMVGLIALLHFGIFALMAMGWSLSGRPVAPLMRAPWRSTGLADFWGPRWNRAFSDIARIAVFRPLVRRLGATAGTLAGFFLSGLLHELVISLPARAGWGLPSLYFAIQGLGVIGERQLFARDQCRARRLFTWLLVLVPAPLLFHPPFLETVLNPGLTILFFES